MEAPQHACPDSPACVASIMTLGQLLQRLFRPPDRPDTCPYCDAQQDRPLTRRRKCQACSQPIHIARDKDGYRRLITASETEAIERAKAERLRDQFAKNRKADLRRMRSVGIEWVIVRTSEDNQVCEECNAQLKKRVRVSDALKSKVHSGSRCFIGWCRCTYEPVIPEAERRQSTHS